MIKVNLVFVMTILLGRFNHALRIKWWPVIGQALVRWEQLKKIQVHIDFSAGAASLSSPEMLIASPKSLLSLASSNSTLVETPLLLAHQLGKRVVKKLPDSALLGVLVLIASELLQREVNTKFLRLPPLVRELANSTALELDAKLEFLSSLQWDVDPFLRTEIENLQNQPLELIDKFVVNEILPRVDKELSPVLSNLIGDPRRVSLITKSIKDLIQSASVVILSPSPSPFNLGGPDETPYAEKTLTESVMQSVDDLGETVEEAIKDWNRIIMDLGKLVKAESILHLIPETLSYNATAGLSIWNLNGDSSPWMQRLGSGTMSRSSFQRWVSPSTLPPAILRRPSVLNNWNTNRNLYPLPGMFEYRHADGSVSGTENSAVDRHDSRQPSNAPKPDSAAGILHATSHTNMDDDPNNAVLSASDVSSRKAWFGLWGAMKRNVAR